MLVTKEMVLFSEVWPGAQHWMCFVRQLGSSFQSSPGDLDQLLGLGSLTKMTAQVTLNPRSLWLSAWPPRDCLLKSVGVSGCV